MIHTYQQPRLYLTRPIHPYKTHIHTYSTSNSIKTLRIDLLLTSNQTPLNKISFPAPVRADRPAF